MLASSKLAIKLANRSPAAPRTLIPAARDFAVKRPEFTMAAGMTALQDIVSTTSGVIRIHILLSCPPGHTRNQSISIRLIRNVSAY